MGATLTVAPNFAYQMAIERIGDRHFRDLTLGALRCAFNGSEAVRSSTVRAFADRFGQRGLQANCMLPVYGMAENTLAATFPGRNESWSSLQLDREALESNGRVRMLRDVTNGNVAEFVSVGTPLAGVTISVRDPNGTQLPSGTVGEVVLRSPSLMDGIGMILQRRSWCSVMDG